MFGLTLPPQKHGKTKGKNMACPHFRINDASGKGHCGKLDIQPLDSTIRNYCQTVTDWKLCPNMGNSCPATISCVHLSGLSDDCKNMTGMGRFRDIYLLSLPNGQTLYDEYYRLAPAIVDAIEQSDERSQYLADILARVRQCVQFYNNGDSESALKIYSVMFDELKSKFVALLP
jgi:hypothetical protein